MFMITINGDKSVSRISWELTKEDKKLHENVCYIFVICGIFVKNFMKKKILSLSVDGQKFALFLYIAWMFFTASTFQLERSFSTFFE